jgi:acyl-CoA thioesterase-1
VKELLLFLVYSGRLFFLAAGLFVVLAALDLFCGRATPGGSFLLLLSLALAVFAGPPLPIAVAIAASVAAVAYVALGRRARPRVRRIVAATAMMSSLLALAVELPYHLRRPRVGQPREFFVIGDSLASGGFGEAAPWPSRLARETGVPVINLALASDNASMALENQVPHLPVRASGGTCAIIEIGGNDMLDATPVGQFATALDRILTAASAAGARTVVMLELPLLPGRWRYGAVQRRMAAKHRCVLVPKSILARVLARPGNTSDGVHLTQAGHDALARDLGLWLNWRRNLFVSAAFYR